MFIKIRSSKMDDVRVNVSMFFGEDREKLQLCGSLVLYNEELADLLFILYGGIELWNSKLPDRRFGIELEGVEGFKEPDLTRKLEVED